MRVNGHVPDHEYKDLGSQLVSTLRHNYSSSQFFATIIKDTDEINT